MKATMPNVLELTAKDLAEFWRHVATGPSDCCWEWVGYCFQGYASYRGHLAHRVAYYIATENLPIDGVVYQTCCNTSCVNPLHLRLVMPNGSAPMLSKFSPRFRRVAGWAKSL